MAATGILVRLRHVDSIGDMIEANRANWDARVPVHLRGYNLDHLRRGGRRLADFEYAAIDVDGRDVLHLPGGR